MRRRVMAGTVKCDHVGQAPKRSVAANHGPCHGRLAMTHVLTLVADRTAISLTQAIIARVRDAVSGGAPEILAEGEAADIPLTAVPNLETVRTALEGLPIDAI